MNDYDPKGYYALLRVLPSASAEEIKAAYRRAAMDLHPDRSKSPDATQLFQRLAEAHRVLSEPDERAIYDRQPIQNPPWHEAEEPEAREEDVPLSDLLVCSCCECVTTQPRYSSFFKVKSFILWTKRERVEGIFCEECAEKTVLKATAVTCLLGWWGPLGILYTLHALAINLFGGERSADRDASLAVEQALAFGQRGETDIAIAIALDAYAISQTLPNDERGKRLKEIVGETLTALGDARSGIRAEDSRPRFGRPFLVQAGVLLFAVGIAYGIVQEVIGRRDVTLNAQTSIDATAAQQSPGIVKTPTANKSESTVRFSTMALEDPSLRSPSTQATTPRVTAAAVAVADCTDVGSASGTCAAMLAKSADRRVDEEYRALMSQLDVQGQLQLRRLQRNWIQRRNYQCRKANGEVDSGCSFAITTAREAELLRSGYPLLRN